MYILFYITADHTCNYWRNKIDNKKNCIKRCLSRALPLLQTGLYRLFQPTTYQAPCQKQSPYRLKNIESIDFLSLSKVNNASFGTLLNIFISPDTNLRKSLTSIDIGLLGLKGDKVSLHTSDSQVVLRTRASYFKDPRFDDYQNKLLAAWLTAVTLIQDDLVKMISPYGAPDGYSGDNLQIKGLSFSSKSLQPGDLIIIGEQVVLLFTGYPHHACNRFGNRFGKEIQNEINTIEHSDARTRGLKLTVINSGHIKQNDCVGIISRKKQPKLWSAKLKQKSIQADLVKRYKLLGFTQATSSEEVIDFFVEAGQAANNLQTKQAQVLAMGSGLEEIPRTSHVK